MKGHEKGAVLYITLLVVVALAAIGTLGVRSVQFEIATARNVKMATQARYVADTGNMISIREFGLHYSAYRKWMSTEDQDWFDFDTDYFRAAATPIFDPGTGAGTWTALGYTDMGPGFSVRVNRGVEMGDASGYAITGTTQQSFCFRKYTFTSLGTIMSSSGLDNLGNSAETIRATSNVGPVVCGI
jgi:hypothetical protein